MTYTYDHESGTWVRNATMERKDLKNKDIVFTGTLSNMTRATAIRHTEKMGARVRNTIGSLVDYLVVADGAEKNSKYQKAINLNISIIDEKTWNSLVNEKETEEMNGDPNTVGKFIGDLGDKIEFATKVENIVRGDWGFGISNIIIGKTKDGRGTKWFWKPEKTPAGLTQGDCIVVTGKVKRFNRASGHYKGSENTEFNYVKFKRKLEL